MGTASSRGVRHRLSPIENISRREGVMTEIRRAIVRGDLQPGHKLTETALAAELGVSRPTVREALGQLANEGLLAQESYRGIRVAQLSAEQMRDTARVRMALDLLAIDLIIADESGSAVRRVRDAFDDFARALEDPDPLNRHEAHVGFHRDMWVASGSSALMRLWPLIESQVALQIAVDARAAASSERDYEIHRRVVEAIESKDRDRIEAALGEHTYGSVDALIAHLG